MRNVIAAALVGLILTGCSASEPDLRQAPPAGSSEVSPSSSTSPVENQSPASSPGPDQTQTGTFSGREAPVERVRLTDSWRPGCPVPVEDLRLLTLDHWGFDGAVHTGELVVHRDQAANVLRAMERLFALKFPIERMELVDVYGADDDRSMAANNTSGFNCRRVEGSPGVWSQHSYGRAVDINPVQNPYVSGSGSADPPAGTAYTDRSDARPGMILSGGGVVEAFASIGWKWGGHWSGSKDYQHFSSNGR